MAGSWMLEFAVILDQHRIWVESGGEAGTKADLCGGESRKMADLTGANLQGAFLQRANLRGRRSFHGEFAPTRRLFRPTCAMQICWEPNCAAAKLDGAQTLYGVEGPLAWPPGVARIYTTPMLPENHLIHRWLESCLGSPLAARRWFYFLMLTICSLCVLCVATTSDPRLILDGQTIPHRASRQYSAHQCVLLDCSNISRGYVRSIPIFCFLRVWSSMAAFARPFFPGWPDRRARRVPGT